MCQFCLLIEDDVSSYVTASLFRQTRQFRVCLAVVELRPGLYIRHRLLDYKLKFAKCESSSAFAVLGEVFSLCCLFSDSLFDNSDNPIDCRLIRQ